MVSVSGDTRPPKRAAWRRTPFQRRLVDFRRLLIRNRLMVRSAAVAFVLGIVAGAVALGLPGWIASGLEFAKTSLGGKIGLRVEVITVAGLQHLSRTEVADALMISPETSLLDVDVAAARGRVMTLGWVKDVTILRLPPNRLHVAVTEYEPGIVWRHDRRSFVADEHGHVIAPVDPAPYGALLHVTGDGAAEAAPDLMEWLKAMPEVAKYVDSAERVGERRWNLHLGNQLVVELPDRGLDEALAVLSRMITKDGLLNRDVLVLDLRDPKEPRLRVNEEAAPPHAPHDNS